MLSPTNSELTNTVLLLICDRRSSLGVIEQAGRLIALDARTNLYGLKLKNDPGNEHALDDFLQVAELLDSVTERVKLACLERARHGESLVELLRAEANRLESGLSKADHSS